MTEQKEQEVCKKCKWRINKFDKKNKKVAHWCVEANCWIRDLVKCPL